MGNAYCRRRKGAEPVEPPPEPSPEVAELRSAWPDAAHRSEAAWSALGELLIDVIPCIVCAGYFREVGSLIGLCHATWRDKNTWGALKQFGRYGRLRQSRLHWACSKGSAARALELLTEFRFDIDTRDNQGMTPLMLAAYTGRANVSRLLLDRGAALEARNIGEGTALYACCQEGHRRVARLLLDRGAVVDSAATFGRTPLYAACEEAHLDIAELLLDRGAAANARLHSGDTPLMVASQRADIELAKLLISFGADANAIASNGCSALQVAQIMGHTDMAALLRTKGAC